MKHHTVYLIIYPDDFLLPIGVFDTLWEVCRYTKLTKEAIIKHIQNQDLCKTINAYIEAVTFTVKKEEEIYFDNNEPKRELIKQAMQKLSTSKIHKN